MMHANVMATAPELRKTVAGSSALLRVLVTMAAACFSLQLAFAFFGIPRALNAWLRCDHVQKRANPEHIVILGGSGIPSSMSLMRAYYGAQCALAHPEARCIVALPAHNDSAENSATRMRDELVIRGVPLDSVQLEPRGMSTHEQAVHVARMVGPAGLQSPIVLVTSPYHMRRAYLCFRKAGFTDIGVLPAHSVGSEADYQRAVQAWSGFGDVRSSLGHLRYGFWSNLTAEIWVVRELIGLTAYKIRGWI